MLAFRHARDGGGVVSSQGGVHVPDVLHVGHVDNVVVRRQPVPQPAADDLELHGFDGIAGHGRGRAIGLLDAHASQVIGELSGRVVREGHARGARRFLHGLPRGLGAQQLQPVALALVEAGRDRAQVGVEPGDELLAHGKERPTVAVAQRGADLFEEGHLAGPVGGIHRQRLLELVEDQDVAVPIAAILRGHVPVQVVG